jgi:hypothetical protein
MPDDANVQPRAAIERGTNADHVITDRNGQERVNVGALEQAIEALCEQLTVANERAERAEQRIDELNAERNPDRPGAPPVVAAVVKVRPVRTFGWASGRGRARGSGRPLIR